MSSLLDTPQTACRSLPQMPHNRAVLITIATTVTVTPTLTLVSVAMITVNIALTVLKPDMVSHNCCTQRAPTATAPACGKRTILSTSSQASPGSVKLCQSQQSGTTTVPSPSATAFCCQSVVCLLSVLLISVISLCYLSMSHSAVSLCYLTMSHSAVSLCYLTMSHSAARLLITLLHHLIVITHYLVSPCCIMTK